MRNYIKRRKRNMLLIGLEKYVINRISMYIINNDYRI